MATTRVQTLRSSVKLQRPANNSREVGELYINFPDRQIGFIDASKVPEDLVPVRFFSATTDYVAGDHVFQSGNVWRAKAVVPAGAFNSAQWDKGTQTPADLLAALITVDGAGSGLDADLLDGQQGAFYAPINAPALTGVPTAPTAAPGDSTTQLATTAFVTTAGNLKANIASPVFTGNPQAPTPGAGDSDTSIATTAFVTGAVSTATTPVNLLGQIMTVDGAGSGLDADLLDGQHGTFYTAMANMTGTISAAQHGSLGGGSLHAAATSTTTGFMLDAPSDGVSYGRKNGAWSTMVGGATISDTPPVSSLLPGQLWYESDSGNTYIWYDDGNSQQWVQQNVMPGTAGMANYYTKAEADAKYVELAGDTMTGALTAPTARVGTTDGSSNGGGLQFFKRTTGFSEFIYFSDGAGGWRGAMGASNTDALVFRAGDAATDDMTLASNGVLTVASDVVAGASSRATQNFISTTTAVVLAPTGAGSVILRPSGAGSTTGQITVDASGNAVFAGNIRSAAGYVGKAGAAGGYAAQLHNWFYNAGPVQCWVDGTNLGNITITSDYRIKKDVVPLASMWDQVKRLRPIRYTQADFTPPAQLAADTADPNKEAAAPMFPADDIERWGFIAHELQENLLPTAANGVKDAEDEVQSLNLAPIVAALTKALQEAMARIEALEARP